MDTFEIATLKATAFTLSKLLKRFHVKLSSQQCLDALSRLVTNKPFEALLASKTDSPTKPDGVQAMTNVRTLKAKATALSRILEGHNVEVSRQLCQDVLARLVIDAPFDALLARQSGNAVAAVDATTALVEGVADAASHSPADALKFMMPLSRPSTPWKKGAVLFMGADGKLQEYEPSKTMTVTTIAAGNLSMQLALQELALKRASEIAADTAKEAVPPDLPVPKAGEPDIEGWTLHPSSSGYGWVITRGYCTPTHGGFLYDRIKNKGTGDSVRSNWKQPPKALYSTRALAERQRDHLTSQDAKGVVHPETAAFAKVRKASLENLGLSAAIDRPLSALQPDQKKASRPGR